jgi:hypothetical protein
LSPRSKRTPRSHLTQRLSSRTSTIASSPFLFIGSGRRLGRPSFQHLFLENPLPSYTLWICSHPVAHDIISRFNYSNIMIIIELSSRGPLPSQRPRACPHAGRESRRHAAGAAKRIPSPFLVSIFAFHSFSNRQSKRLEIAVTQRKQSSRAISNR